MRLPQMIAVCFAGLSVGQVTAAPPALRVSGEAIERRIVDQAIEAFWQTCPALVDHEADIEEIRVSIGEEYADHRLAKGWNKSFHIAIALSDDLRTMPNILAEPVGIVSGQTLHYDIGGGGTPGIFASKPVSQHFCAVEVSTTGSDTFRAVPEFGFIPE